jgi:hypothetical protein
MRRNRKNTTGKKHNVKRDDQERREDYLELLWRVINRSHC